MHTRARTVGRALLQRFVLEVDPIRRAAAGTRLLTCNSVEQYRGVMGGGQRTQLKEGMFGFEGLSSIRVLSFGFLCEIPRELRNPEEKAPATLALSLSNRFAKNHIQPLLQALSDYLVHQINAGKKFCVLAPSFDIDPSTVTSPRPPPFLSLSLSFCFFGARK